MAVRDSGWLRRRQRVDVPAVSGRHARLNPSDSRPFRRSFTPMHPMPRLSPAAPVPQPAGLAAAGTAPSAADIAAADSVPAAAAWSRVRERLAAECGDKTYASWLKPICLLGAGSDEVRLGLPSRFMADWVRNHFADQLRRAFVAETGAVREIVIEVAAAAAAAETPAGPAPALPVSPLAPESPAFEPRYGFDSFVVGKSNELAFNAAQTLADCVVAANGSASFNPLFLHGGTGLGKTHLMHAVGGRVLAGRPSARIVYLSAEKFMVEFLAALRARDTIAFKQRLRSCDLLMIDDVQFIAGKDSTQEEFFHTMNEIINAGKWLVISADRSPQNLEGIESRILSRLAWGLVADVNPADYELRYNILCAKLAAQPQAAVPDAVIEFLARKIVANVRELEGALNRVIAYSRLVDRPIDLDFAREVLADVLRAHSRRLTIDEIQRRVAEHYALKLNDLLSARRTRDIARPRQVAMYLAKMLTPRSLPEIGRRFGGRDHTTVMHAVKQIEKLRATDHELDRDIAQLRRLLDG
jgi:chromosomal replication initiator protein